MTLGSSGSGAAGGGALRLSVGGTLDFAGSIVMDGGASSGGTGAGGSVLLEACTFMSASTARVSAAGGAASGAWGYAGGGGCVALHCTHAVNVDPCTTNITTRGGAAPASSKHGAAGTVYLDCGTCNRTLLVDNAGPSGAVRRAGVTGVLFPGSAAIALEHMRVAGGATVVVLRDTNSSMVLSARRFSGDGTGTVWLHNSTTLLLADGPRSLRLRLPELHNSSIATMDCGSYSYNIKQAADVSRCALATQHRHLRLANLRLSRVFRSYKQQTQCACCTRRRPDRCWRL